MAVFERLDGVFGEARRRSATMRANQGVAVFSIGQKAIQLVDRCQFNITCCISVFAGAYVSRYTSGNESNQCENQKRACTTDHRNHFDRLIRSSNRMESWSTIDRKSTRLNYSHKC